MSMPKVVNTKSMFAHLCKTMEKLDNAEVDVATAEAQCKLVQQAGNLLAYELKRAELMSNTNFKDEHRNLELKNFDYLPE